MQLFAGLETNSLAGSYADFGAGAGISSNSGFASANAEHAKAAQFNAFPSSQSLFEAFKDGINGSLGLGARQPGAFDHLVNNVLFDQ